MRQHGSGSGVSHLSVLTANHTRAPCSMSYSPGLGESSCDPRPMVSTSRNKHSCKPNSILLVSLGDHYNAHPINIACPECQRHMARADVPPSDHPLGPQEARRTANQLSTAISRLSANPLIACTLSKPDARVKKQRDAKWDQLNGLSRFEITHQYALPGHAELSVSRLELLVRCQLREGNQESRVDRPPASSLNCPTSRTVVKANGDLARRLYWLNNFLTA